MVKVMFREPTLAPWSAGCPGELCPCHGPGVRRHAPPLVYEVAGDQGEERELPPSPATDMVIATILRDLEAFAAQPK